MTIVIRNDDGIPYTYQMKQVILGMVETFLDHHLAKKIPRTKQITIKIERS